MKYRHDSVPHEQYEKAPRPQGPPPDIANLRSARVGWRHTACDAVSWLIRSAPQVREVTQIQRRESRRGVQNSSNAKWSCQRRTDILPVASLLFYPLLLKVVIFYPQYNDVPPESSNWILDSPRIQIMFGIFIYYQSSPDNCPQHPHLINWVILRISSVQRGLSFQLNLPLLVQDLVPRRDKFSAFHGGELFTTRSSVH